MSQRAKGAYIGLLGVIGLIMLLVGVLTHIYAVTTGVIIAIGCWVGCGILARYWAGRKKKSSRKLQKYHYMNR